MAAIEHTVEIDAPVSEVFAHLAEPEKVPRWQASLVELRKESEGPMAAGTRLTEVRSFLGKRIESTLEVTAYEPDRRFDLKTVSGPIPFDVRHTLVPLGDRTRLEVVGRGESGGVFKLADALVTRQAKRQLRADFARLKELLEGRE